MFLLTFLPHRWKPPYCNQHPYPARRHLCGTALGWYAQNSNRLDPITNDHKQLSTTLDQGQREIGAGENVVLIVQYPW